jgi:poly(A) polymerase
MSERSEPIIYKRDKHSLARREIDPDALKIMYRLSENRFHAYLVGGGVRDLLLKKKPKDFDIATNATPRQVKALFRNCRIIGRRFKLAHVFFHGGKIIEVSTFRDMQDQFEGEAEEIQGLSSDDNVYGTAETDAFRRDLTINALFFDATDGAIIDYVGGMKDINDKIVRVIGDPNIRYQEDPVRMVRVVRQACRTGFSIDPAARTAIVKHHNLLQTVPAMRIFEEFKKDIVAGSFLETLRTLESVELLQHLLPEVCGTELLSNGSYLTTILRKFDELFLIEEPVSITAALSVLALIPYLQEPDSNIVVEQIEDARALRDYLGTTFTKIAVPRKERERIEDVLRCWYDLKSRGPDAKYLNPVLRTGTLADLKQFSRLMANRESDEEIIALLDEVDQRGSQNGNHGDEAPNGHRRNGGGSRRGRGGGGRMMRSGMRR